MKCVKITISWKTRVSEIVNFRVFELKKRKRVKREYLKKNSESLRSLILSCNFRCCIRKFSQREKLSGSLRNSLPETTLKQHVLSLGVIIRHEEKDIDNRARAHVAYVIDGAPVFDANYWCIVNTSVTGGYIYIDESRDVLRRRLRIRSLHNFEDEGVDKFGETRSISGREPHIPSVALYVHQATRATMHRSISHEREIPEASAVLRLFSALYGRPYRVPIGYLRQTFIEKDHATVAEFSPFLSGFHLFFRNVFHLTHLTI